MIQKKRELHLSYSQAFGVARKTDCLFINMVDS